MNRLKVHELLALILLCSTFSVLSFADSDPKIKLALRGAELSCNPDVDNKMASCAVTPLLNRKFYETRWFVKAGKTFRPYKKNSHHKMVVAVPFESVQDELTIKVSILVKNAKVARSIKTTVRKRKPITPTPSASASPTTSPSNSPTIAPSIPSNTPTHAPSANPTVQSTNTPVPPTTTATVNPTVTRTAIPTATSGTAVATPTPVFNSTATPTRTPTRTSTSTITATPTRTNTPTGPAATATRTPTRTATAAATATSTRTATPTNISAPSSEFPNYQNPPSLPAPTGSVIQVSTLNQLQNAVANLHSGDTIMINAGTYNLTDSLYVPQGITNIAIRGATGRSDDVVIRGNGLAGSIPFGIWIGNVQGIIIADLTIRDVNNDGIILNAGAESPLIHNVHLMDIGDQMIKVNPDGNLGGVDNGVLEYSVMEYTTGFAPDYYVAGIDTHTAKNWVIKYNLFKNFRVPVGSNQPQVTHPAVLLWNDNQNSQVLWNTFINNDRDISVGLYDASGNNPSQPDAQGGRIEGNMIYRDTTTHGDVAIFVAGPNTNVYHNTYYDESGSYPNGIEYRFASSHNGKVTNNLLNRAISLRDGATAIISSNVTNVQSSLFLSVATGDLHLKSSAASAINTGTTITNPLPDYDGQTRDANPDIGADEYSAASSQSPTATPTGTPNQPTATPTRTPTPAQSSGLMVTSSVTNGSTLSGSIAWTATASGGTITKLEFYIDNVLKWNETAAPYQYNGDPSGELDTSTLTNGAHALKVTATASDSSTVSVSSTVTVSNIVIPTATPTRTPTPGGPTPTPTQTPTPSGPCSPSDKLVLNQSDFTYLGAFDQPYSLPGGGDYHYPNGLTHRYVNGELHMFSVSLNPQNFFEYKVPAPSINNPPEAEFIKNWGDVPHGKNVGLVTGVYWDQIDQRLYWTSQDQYCDWACVNNTAPIGYSTLNDSDGSSNSVAAYFLSGHNAKEAGNCIISIPQPIADSCFGGARLAAGCGGYESAITAGPPSIGPALTAFVPPTNQPHRATLQSTNLVGYPANLTPYTDPDRAHRDVDYVNDFDGWNPRIVNGQLTGYWSWSDQMKQSGIWIDTPTKHGVLFAPTMGNGDTWYETSTLHAERASHAWFVYDPADLVAVAHGQKQEWQIQGNFWNVQYPGMNYPLPGWQDYPGNMVVGIDFDSTTSRLYVLVRWAGQGGVGRVFVYGVN